MKVNDQISYYCFNKTCTGSVYSCINVEVTDLPFNEQTLTSEHRCPICNAKLVSVVDIELRQAIHSTPAKSKLLRFAQRV